MIEVARQSIRLGLGEGHPFRPEPNNYSPALQERKATFVTLSLGQDLRGCVGVLEAEDPLVVDVAQNAFRAAFRDPRFSPLKTREFAGLQISLSILSPLEKIPCASERDLLEKIRPGLDGLVLRKGSHVGTFLPAVWEDFPQAADFLSHLKTKAGLPTDFWSPELEWERFTVEVIAEDQKVPATFWS